MREELIAGTAEWKGRENPNVKEFKCNKCDETFVSNATLKEHVQRILPRNITCKHCDETLKETWKLEKHLRTHTETTTFNCEDCGKEFGNALKAKCQKMPLL